MLKFKAKTKTGISKIIITNPAKYNESKWTLNCGFAKICHAVSFGGFIFFNIHILKSEVYFANICWFIS